MNVCVIGAGYVGLTTAALLSELGHQVTCVDQNEEKIRTLNEGRLPLYEPGLSELVDKTRRKGRLHFGREVARAVQTNEVIIIAVGTPAKADGRPDLSSVYQVAATLALSIDHQKLIIIKSTVPPGTNTQIEKKLQKTGMDKELFDIVSNPEFLQEGNAVRDSFHPDKIVIGLKSRDAEEKVRALYKGITAPYIVTTPEGAEMAKYASNAFLAMKISFINEIANICEAYNVNVTDVAEAIGLDPRIGPHFLNAGLGYGGSCLPKDVHALIHTALAKKLDPRLLKAARQTNESQISVYTEKLKRLLPASDGTQVTVWGMAFKANTDDVRQSPAVKLITRLAEEGYDVHAYDPLAKASRIDAVRHEDLYASVDGSAALVLATDWDLFKNANWAAVKQRMKGRLILDCRNCLDPSVISFHGFTYEGVARG